MLKIEKKGKRSPVYDLHVAKDHNFFANDVLVHNCTEILEPNMVDQEVSVCNLGSIVLGKCVKDGKVDKAKIRKITEMAVKFLDKVIDRNFYPVPEAKNSNSRWRPVGLGVMGLQDLLFKLRIPFDSEEAVKISEEIQEEIYYQALKTSNELAKEYEPHKDFDKTKAAQGLLQFDLAGYPKDEKRWNDLKESIKEHGLRNSLLIAIAPTVTIAAITGSSECIEPQNSNMFKRETLSGEFVSINKYLVEDLKEIDMWNSDTRNIIKRDDGSVQNLELPQDDPRYSKLQDIKNLYKNVWEIKQKWLIDHAAARGKFIDQSQSLNLFMSTPEFGKMSSMYMYSWEKGIKTTYYLRSKPKSKIAQVGSSDSVSVTGKPTSFNLQPPAQQDEICESCT